MTTTTTGRGAPPPRTVPELLDWRTALHPDRVAVEVHGVARLTFAEWSAGAGAVAAALRHRGLRHGDRVGLVFGAHDWTRFAVAYCGVLRAGGVAVPLSDRLAAGQLGYALTHCAATAVVHGDDTPTPPVPPGLPVWTCGDLLADPGTNPDQADTDPKLSAARPGDLAQILYTSGTTGRPKGVAASHANLTAGAPSHPRRLALAHSERFLHAFAIGTNAGQTMLLNALTAKAGALTLPRFTPLRFARLVEAAGTGTVFVVPSIAVELLDSGALRGRDTSGVQLIGSTAAPLAPAIAARLAAAFPQATIVNYYTSTEAAPAQTTMIYDPTRRDAVGRPVGGQLMVADAHGNPLPAGTTGDVWLCAPYPRAYYRDEAANRATFRDGWVRMGDVGRVDADGYLYLTDRHQDVIKTGAFKVSTLEVEAALHEHPLVAEAAVVGVPHPVLGSAVAAAVVPRPPTGPDGLSLPALRGFLADRLADYQLPARLLLLDRLPRNEGGKVLKRQLTGLFDN
ncbi:class I adenylate-forming enzyme family protein [Micromonospora narathiwatensis]|uniref:Acyl-CoA synthetase (AMP-forming)/AMP-acid ligase II n=1 Tax=Micromonospora narathiwatensis TaxID=299146 RepID=A0A1A8ZPI0_9ACTN|nr:AMP-binding protein [Micromonospora narathiwatensis]SBT46018.1 Acyl-CoA synthetase (AMP-forming)/AMP-acid ligase II [Micromonospora narathiwatensis]